MWQRIDVADEITVMDGGKGKKAANGRSVKLSAEVYERYFGRVKPADVAGIMEDGRAGDVVWDEGECIIFHKYRASQPYHQHGRARSLGQAVRNIMVHDVFQMNGRKRS